MARIDPRLLTLDLLQDDDKDDFVVSHPMTRVRIAGKKIPVSAVPPPHLMKLSTIKEESFSSMESAPDYVFPDDSDSMEISTNTREEPMTLRQHEKPSTPPCPNRRGGGGGGAGHSHSRHRRAHLDDTPTAAANTNISGGGGASRGARNFCVALVSLVFLDVVLFAVSYAWTPVFIFSLVLLGMVVGMIVSATLWYLAGPSSGEGGAVAALDSVGADDADSISHCTHFPDPGTPCA
jgi:hypothetical protein